jgi:hypothetical protein
MRGRLRGRGRRGRGRRRRGVRKRRRFVGGFFLLSLNFHRLLGPPSLYPFELLLFDRRAVTDAPLLPLSHNRSRRLAPKNVAPSSRPSGTPSKPKSVLLRSRRRQRRRRGRRVNTPRCCRILRTERRWMTRGGWTVSSVDWRDGTSCVFSSLSLSLLLSDRVLTVSTRNRTTVKSSSAATNARNGNISPATNAPTWLPVSLPNRSTTKRTSGLAVGVRGSS